MQYALFDGQFRKFLLDATEFSILKKWQKNPIEELSNFNESKHPHHVCYGGYLLNPEASEDNIDKKLKAMEGLWLAAIDDYERYFHQIALYSIYPLPMISVGHRRIVPFAALIKSDDSMINKIAAKSGFAVTAFLRIKEWDIATNILNREGIFAFNGVEMRFKNPASEDNWQKIISEDRAYRCANKLIECNRASI